MAGRAAGDRLRLCVRLTPRASCDRIDGFAPAAEGSQGGRPMLRVRVTAPPVDGAANAALVRLLAKALGVARSAVRIAAGETSRIKTVEIAGDPIELAAGLDALALDRSGEGRMGGDR